MSGRAGVDENQRFLASHLADGDAVRREAQRLSQEVFHVDGICRAECDLVFCRAF